jgi:hypothetical protein
MRPTKSFLEPIHGARFAPLVNTRSVKDVADACRSAGLGFAWGANRGWGRLELARWLVGPYERAISSTRHLRGSGMHRRVKLEQPLDPRDIEAVLVRTHTRLIETLRASWSWTDDAHFARDILDAGLVVGVADDHGGIGFAPNESEGMRLIDRVRSLFIADFLTRPHDYARFGVCDGCDGVTFDWAGLHDDCSSAFRAPTPTPSRIVLKRAPRTTLIGLL